MEINALSILGVRCLDFIPKNFLKFKMDDNYFISNRKEIEVWITNNLSGRYAISSMPEIDSEDRLKVNTFVGFESHKELTVFMLACPHLRRK